MLLDLGHALQLSRVTTVGLRTLSRNKACEHVLIQYSIWSKHMHARWPAHSCKQLTHVDNADCYPCLYVVKHGGGVQALRVYARLMPSMKQACTANTSCTKHHCIHVHRLREQYVYTCVPVAMRAQQSPVQLAARHAVRVCMLPTLALQSAVATELFSN